MARRKWVLLGLGMALCVAAHRVNAAGSESALRGPVLGFVFDGAAQALRPILGIPGAATLGDPIDVGRPIVDAVVASRQDHALAVAADDGSVLEIGLRTGSSAQPLAGAAAWPDYLVLSPSGSAAALCYVAARRVQVLSGLPGAPVVTREIDLSPFSDPVTAMAVSDDSNLLLAGFAGTDSGAVYAFQDGTARLVLALRVPASLQFLNGSPDVLIADGAANLLYLVHDPGGAAAATTLAGAESGIAGPAAVQVAADNRRAFVANVQTGTVTTLNLDTGAAVSLACGCTPSGLARLSGTAVFRLNELSGDPLWILDADAPYPRVVFVPAPAQRR